MKKLLLAPAVAVALTGFAFSPALAASTAGSFTAETAVNSLASERPSPAPTADPNVFVTPEITAEDLKSEGVVVVVANAQPGSPASDSLTLDPVEVPESGTASWMITAEFDADPGVTDFTVTYIAADGEEVKAAVSFEVVEAYSDDATDEPTESPSPTEDPSESPDPTPTDDGDDAIAQFALTVSPQEITPADFVNKDKGVVLTVGGLEPGEEVEYAVSPSGSNVNPLTETSTADENGVAVWSVHGTNSSDPSAYIGAYDVAVTNEAGDKVTGSFSVTETPGDDGSAGEEADDDTNGDDSTGDDKGEGDGSGDLPRTGAELGGLAAGATLLTVGAAAVLLTRRRAAKS